MPTIVDLIEYLLQVCFATAVQLFILVGVAIILGFLIHVISRTVEAHAASIFPPCVYDYLFLIPGIALHEIAHMSLAVLFGFQIGKVVLFQCQPGVPYRGYVVQFGRRSYFKRIGGFFIGVAPIVVGAVVIYGLSRILLGPGLFAGVTFTLQPEEFLNLATIAGRLYESIVTTTMTVLGRLITLRGVPGWQIGVFLYMVYSIANSMHLSAPDLRYAASGLSAIYGLLLLVNLVAMAGGENALLPYVMQLNQMYGLIYSILIFALSLNIIAAVIVVPLGIIFNRNA